MPGRQAHGRSLVAAPKAKKGGKNSKARSQKNALNAFGIAQEHFPTKEKRTPRLRELEAGFEHKRSRADDDDDDDDEGDEEEGPQRKKAKVPSRPANDNAEFGSDSEGNEWQLGGMAEDDEDSEIESDDAFGESDNEKFQGYSFRGSKSQKKDDDDSEDDENDDEGETLGEEAIDLATALDQWEESEDEPQGKGEENSDSDESGSEGSDESNDDSEEDEDGESDDDNGDGEEADPERLEALKGLVSGFGGEDDQDKSTSAKQKINLGDLGLSGLDDPFMRNSLKLMNKEAKEKRPGATKKLDVPLSRREQGRIDRSAAYDKTKETLDRWTETVKHNRRAEHLVFPLPDGKQGMDMTNMLPIQTENNTNELESAILSIMDQSGLTMEKPKKEKPKVYDEDGNELSRKEIINQKRLEREQQQREAKRAARIKKIKSKAYHRVHRRQQERADMAAHEAMVEAGEIDSEEEREAADRRRALERVGQRHKESKWAKANKQTKRAVWDDDYRAGLKEMSRKDEDLRRRKDGKGNIEDSDATSSSGSDSEDEQASLKRQLAILEEEDEKPEKGLMSMKFMQKAEASRKQEIEDLKRQLQAEIDGSNDIDAGSDEDVGGEVGRRQYGSAQPAIKAALDTSQRAPKKQNGSLSTNGAQSNSSRSADSGNAWSASADADKADAPADTIIDVDNAWAVAKPKSKRKGQTSSNVNVLDAADTMAVSRSAPKSRSKKPSSPAPSYPANAAAASRGAANDDADSESDTDMHLPLTIKDRELVEKAFAGDDVLAEFEKEKDEVAEADDDKVIDNTLPGWGSWVGDGVSKRDKERHKGRFLTKVEGIKKKDRKDAKLDKVIINEKRIKKNDQYLATQLPFPFESREQYERSLRLPVGPEWQTKETFQESTKPRVIVKSGIIAPISKPTR